MLIVTQILVILSNLKHFKTYFVSTCKQLTQSEPMEFSKNGVFHSKSEAVFLCMDFLLVSVSQTDLPFTVCASLHQMHISYNVFA